MREDEQEEAKLWEKVSSADGDTKVDALLQLNYNAAGQQEYTEALAFCATARETYEALGAIASRSNFVKLPTAISFPSFDAPITISTYSEGIN